MSNFPKALLHALCLTACIATNHTASAQTIASCSSVASDPDGDGFGWENNASCRVTEGSNGAPEFINLETGQPVSLTRAYWDPTDFDNPITCGERYFDGIGYEQTYRELFIEHGRLSPVTPFQGRLELTARAEAINLPWALENGIYTGPTGLSESPWVEVVDLFKTGGDTGHGVRIWHSNHSYTRCAPLAPDRNFIPTGTPPVPENLFTGTCVDTDPLGDGWGWDGTTSCSIPVNNPETGICVDLDGDGWGWNGVDSCQI